MLLTPANRWFVCSQDCVPWCACRAVQVLGRDMVRAATRALGVAIKAGAREWVVKAGVREVLDGEQMKYVIVMPCALVVAAAPPTVAGRVA